MQRLMSLFKEKPPKPNEPLSPDKFVVFDWDNTLSHQSGLMDKARDLAFPKETAELLKTLSKQNVYIEIVSSATLKEDIAACLEENGLDNYVKNINGKKEHENKLDSLSRIKEKYKDKVTNNKQLCLADDDYTTSYNAANIGYSVIPCAKTYTDNKHGDRITDAAHLNPELYTFEHRPILAKGDSKAEDLLSRWECVRKIIGVENQNNWKLQIKPPLTGAKEDRNREFTLQSVSGVQSDDKYDFRVSVQLVGFLRKAGIGCQT